MNTTQYASDSFHWYAQDGSPCYEVPRADGKGTRPTTLRDAKKLGLVPSVTTITKLLAKRGLEVWLQRQVMLSALTMPRRDGESDAAFCDRILEEGKEAARIAAERGTALHTAIEKALQGNPQTEWDEHVQEVFSQLALIGIDVSCGTSERSFAHPDGYGGRIDLSSDTFLLDFKSKERIEDGKDYTYEEHIIQLASYSHGIGSKPRRLLNVFVGVEDRRVLIHEWSQKEAEIALKKFYLLLEYWKLRNLQ